MRINCLYGCFFTIGNHGIFIIWSSALARYSTGTGRETDASILDEPMANLSPELCLRLANKIDQTVHDVPEGRTALVVEHRPFPIADFADAVLTIQNRCLRMTHLPSVLKEKRAEIQRLLLLTLPEERCAVV